MFSQCTVVALDTTSCKSPNVGHQAEDRCMAAACLQGQSFTMRLLKYVTSPVMLSLHQASSLHVSSYLGSKTHIQQLLTTSQACSRRLLSKHCCFVRLSVISSLARLCLQVTLPSSGPLQEGRIQQLLTYHSGSIVGLATSPYSHMAITAGADGTVRLYDYR